MGGRWAGRVAGREAAQRSLLEASLGTGKQLCLLLSVSVLSWKPLLLVTVRGNELKSPEAPAVSRETLLSGSLRHWRGPRLWVNNCISSSEAERGSQINLCPPEGFAQAFSATSRLAESCSSFQIREMLLPGHKEMIEQGEHCEILGIFAQVVFSWPWESEMCHWMQCMELCFVLGIANGNACSRAGMQACEA